VHVRRGWMHGKAEMYGQEKAEPKHMIARRELPSRAPQPFLIVLTL
jgi:hypothetical protein